MSSGRGFFLTIEGVEGAGKSTLAAAIGREISRSGREVVITAEPGGDILSDRIRGLVLDLNCKISDRAELLLFEAARAQHVDVKIRPALSRGAVVICDRFIDSSIAYQGFARGIDIDTVRWLNNYATSGLKPDLTILLDLPPDTGLARQLGVDRVSSEGIAFLDKVRQGYISIAASEPERFVRIDASRSMEEVTSAALAAVSKFIRELSGSDC